MRLVIFGLGYSAEVFARRIAPRTERIVATKRNPEAYSGFAPPGGGIRASRPGSHQPSPRVAAGRADSRGARAGWGAAQPAERFDSSRRRPPTPARPRGEPGGDSALPAASGGRVEQAAAAVRERASVEREGRAPVLRAFPGEEAVLAGDIAEADAILVSIPPGREGDPVLARFAEALAAAPRLRWLGYLSTVGIYGDHGGAWVDETTPPRPRNGRSDDRLLAEEAWLRLGRERGVPVHVFRIAGIYGPGRSAFDKLAAGTAKRIVKPGQVFNRIHVEDIAAVLEASLERPRPGAIYNLADDEPSPPQDVIAEAARLAGLPLPPEIPLEEAGLSPMGLSFWGETKRVSNRLIREELGVDLIAPSYREGLRAILRASGPMPA